MSKTLPLLVDEDAKSSKPNDPLVAGVLDLLKPLGSLSLCRSARLVLILRWRCKRQGARLVSAGQLRAAHANKKLGRVVADSESTTFTQELAARTGMHPKRAQRLVTFGALGAARLRRLQHTKDDHQRPLQALVGLDEAYRDGAPPTPTAPTTDWWQAVPGFDESATKFHLPGVVTLHQGDSERVLQEYPDATFDGCVSDQPYGVAYISSKQQRVEGDATVKDTACWLVPTLQRVLKADAFSVLHGQEPVDHEWTVEMADGGFRRADTVIWDKAIASVRGGTVRRRHEQVYIFARGKPHKPKSWVDHWGLTGAEPGTRITKDDSIWPHEKPTDSSHPTAKPPELHQRELLNYYPVGTLLLDPCMGTGPVAVAALRTGHRFVGGEKMQDYYRAAVERVVAELRTPGVAAHWKRVLGV